MATPSQLVGQTVSHYRIIEKLGSGGMGVVYKAEDTQLHRLVALKFLPENVANDPEAVRRFRREAEAASALNHANICTIYGVGEAEGQPFIVMELLQGQTLKQRIASGVLPLDELLEIAVQIGAALEAAHMEGIVHRDLKPSNIFITSRGQAKILDFGVAKIAPKPTPIAEGMGTSTTATLEMPAQNVTTAGLALGTVSYMAPEQLRGDRLDGRSDLFSFGVVLYQMGTGILPFFGDTSGAVLEAILIKQPVSARQLNPRVPAELDGIICKALEKDRDLRYQSAADLRSDLRRLQRYGSGTGSASAAVLPQAKRATRRRLLGTGVFALFLLTIIGTGVWRYWHIPVTKTAAPRIVPITSYVGQPRAPAFSPTGNEIAFLWDGGTGRDPDVYIKLIGEGPALRLTALPGPKAGPVWSPDGRYLAFIRGGKDPAIFQVPALGGQERRLVNLQSPISGLRPNARQFDWSGDGTLLAVADKLTPDTPRSIFLVNLRTGERRRLTSPPETGEDFLPTFSPDGQTIAFGRAIHSFVENICLVRVSGGPERQLTFLENAFLGEGLSWTADGKEIVFSSVEGPSKSSLWRVSITGGAPERLLVGLGVQNAAEPAVSPQGNRLAYTQISTNVNIWQIPLTSRVHKSVKLIFSTRYQDGPQYSPDGSKIIFVSDRSGSSEIWVSNKDGSSPTQLTSFAAQDTGTPRWSPDGRYIVFDSLKSGNDGVYVMNADGSGVRPLAVDSHTNNVASCSRDGRWVYFASDRKGRDEVWKVPFEGGEPVQVTRHGGFVPLEAPDGKWLYYMKAYYGEPGLWRIPVRGGTEEPVMPWFRPEDWGAWAVGDRGVYFVDSVAAPQPELKLFEPETNRLKRIITLEKLPALSGNPVLAVSPDEEAILYTQIDDVKSDIMLLDNFR
jgi:eukaryotic-like serine/threonine-protein kinase